MSAEAQKYEGYWWLPDNPEKKAPGRLLIDQHSKIDVEAIGSLLSKKVFYSNDLSLLSREVLLGETADGKYLVTLLKVNVRLHSGTYIKDSTDFASSVYSAGIAIIGRRCFLSESEAVFSAVRVEFTLLEEWLCQSGLTLRKDEDGNYPVDPVIEYKFPESLEFDIDAIQAKLEISYGYNFDSPTHFRWQLSHRSFLTLKPFSKQSLDWYSKKIESLRRLLVLMTGFPLSIKGIAGFEDYDLGNGDDENPREDGFDIYIKSSDSSIENGAKHPANLLINLPSANIPLSTIANTWFEKTDIVEEPAILYIASFAREARYAESSLLRCTQGLEALYVGIYGKDKLGQRSQAKRLLNEVWEDCLIEFIENKEAFIQEVFDTRNYWIHFTPNVKAKAAVGQEVFLLAERLRILLVTHLLLQLKIPRDSVYSAVKKFSSFSYLKVDSKAS